MKKIQLLTSSLILALAACQNSGTAKSEKKSNIVATYNGGEVSSAAVDYELGKIKAKNEKLKNLTFENLSADQKEALIKEIVIKEIAYKEAKKRGLNKEDDYQAALKLFESDLLKQKLLVALVKEAQEEKNLHKNYDELAAKANGKKDFKISYIAVKTQKEADEIFAALTKNPSSFAAQAKKKSLDKEVAKKGGELGFVMEDALSPEVSKEIKNLKKGEISKPISSAQRWVIVRFEDEKNTEILPYEKAKDALSQQLARKAVEDFVSQNLEKAKISLSVK